MTDSATPRAAPSRPPWPLPVRVAAGAVVGWFVVDLGQGPAPSWTRPTAALLLAGVAAGAAGMARRWPGRGLGTGAALGAFVGIYVCVPETERVLSAAVLAAIPFIAEITGQLPTAWPTILASAALAVWAAYYGGVFRDSALVGGFASLGLLLLEPVSVRLPGPRRGIPPPFTVPALLALQVVYAVAVGRHAGLRPSLASAIAVAVPMALALTIVARLVIGRRP